MAKSKPAPNPYGNASHLLISALDAVAPELHPGRPFHGGGPPPKIDAANYVTAALWAAARARPFARPDDLAEIDRMIALATRQVALGVDDTTLFPQLLAASRLKTSRMPLRIAAWACHEAHNWAARPIYAGGAARPAIGHLARLTSKHLGDAATTALLVEIDRLSVHLEAMFRLAEHELVPPAKPVATRWRGSVGDASSTAEAIDKAVAWILALDDGSLALISKLGARWKLTCGDRAFVLAHVADDLLDGAAAATA